MLENKIVLTTETNASVLLLPTTNLQFHNNEDGANYREISIEGYFQLLKTIHYCENERFIRLWTGLEESIKREEG